MIRPLYRLTLLCAAVLVLAYLAPFSSLRAQDIVTSNISNNAAFERMDYRRSFFAHDMHWIVYSRDQDGSWGNVYYRTSDHNSGVWSAKTLLFVGMATGSSSWDLWFDGTYIHYIHAEVGPSNDIAYRMGVPESDGSVTWVSAEQTIVCPWPYESNSHICTDSNGYPWVSYNDGNGDIHVLKSSTKDGTFTNDAAAGSPWIWAGGAYSYNSPRILPLTSGRMVVIYNHSGPDDKLVARRYTGSAWGSEATTVVEVDGAEYSCVAVDDEVHITMQEAGTDDNMYVHYDYSTNSFDIELDLYTSGAPTPPTMQLNTDNNDIYVYWGNEPVTDHVYYSVYDNSEGSWTVGYDWIDESIQDGLPASSSALMNCDYTCTLDTAGLYYVADGLILKHKLLTLPWAVETLVPDPITTTTATLRGNVLTAGSGTIAIRGFRYGTDETMAVYTEITEAGSFGEGVYTELVEDLTADSIYYVQAIVEDSYGETASGEIVGFLTDQYVYDQDDQFFTDDDDPSIAPPMPSPVWDSGFDPTDDDSYSEGSLPFGAELINELLNEDVSGFPLGFWYYLIALVVIVGVGVFALLRAGGHILLITTAGATTIFLFCAMGYLDWWMLFPYLITAFSLMVAEKKIAY